MMKEVLIGDAPSLALGANILPIFLQALQREAETDSLQLFRTEDSRQRWDENEDNSRANFATRLENLLQTNLKNPPTLEEAAQEMYLSRAQFARCVRRETGKTFNELLAAHRIAEAKRLLSTSNWTIASIGWRIGLKSPSYFRTFFRLHTGQTPTQFRVESTTASISKKRRLQPQ
jgi:AraC-like DNA-binding protein